MLVDLAQKEFDKALALYASHLQACQCRKKKDDLKKVRSALKKPKKQKTKKTTGARFKCLDKSVMCQLLKILLSQIIKMYNL